jgi:hypothetical protein
MKCQNLRSRYFLAFMMAAVLGYGSPTIAADDPPDFMVTYPAGLACVYFDLQIEGWNGKQHVKEFKDKNGNVVRALSAGRGSALRYTNVSTGQTFSSKSNGAVAHTTYNPDGSSTLKLTGHNVVILFPTDSPPGPSTTLYDGGRVVISIDASGNFTVKEESGNKTNICAAVSQ